VGLEGHEVGERLEPEGVELPEIGERAETRQTERAARSETVRGVGEGGPEVMVEPAVVGAPPLIGCAAASSSAVSRPAAGEFAEVDEIGLPGAAGEQLVRQNRRSPWARWGRCCQMADAGGGEEIDERAGAGAEVADAVVAGQRGNVGEHARGAGREQGGRRAPWEKEGRVGRRPTLGALREGKRQGRPCLSRN